MRGTARSLSGAASGRLCLRQARLLVDAEEVPGWVEERRQDLTPGRSRRKHDVAPAGSDRGGGGGCIGNHDVGQDAGLGIRCPVENPGATDLSGGVVEGRTVGIAKPNVPAEDTLVESSRLADVESRDLQIAE